MEEIDPLYKPYLGPYEAVVYDGNEPIGWGFRLKNQMPSEMFNNFPGTPFCLGLSAYAGFNALSGRAMGEWVFVIKWLKPSEAVKKYGDVIKIIVGPKGGWRGVFYGQTPFLNKVMDPRGSVPCPDPLKE